MARQGKAGRGKGQGRVWRGKVRPGEARDQTWYGTMQQQLQLFDISATAVAEPCDPHVEPVDLPRLKGQNGKILERLQKGPATNKELATISLKYTSRVSDLRKAGHHVENYRKDGDPSGVTRYRLVE